MCIFLSYSDSINEYIHCRLKQNKQPEEEVLAQQEDVSDEEEVLICCSLSYACHLLLLSTASVCEPCILLTTAALLG